MVQVIEKNEDSLGKTLFAPEANRLWDPCSLRATCVGDAFGGHVRREAKVNRAIEGSAWRSESPLAAFSRPICERGTAFGNVLWKHPKHHNQIPECSDSKLNWLDRPERHSTDHRMVLLFFCRWRVVPGSPVGCRGEREVNLEFAAVDFLFRQLFHSFHGTLDINKVRVSETSGLAGSAIDCDPDVNDVPHTAEQVCEVPICHLKGHVADEEGLGRRVQSSAGSGGTDLCLLPSSVLDCDATAFEKGHV